MRKSIAVLTVCIFSYTTLPYVRPSCMDYLISHSLFLSYTSLQSTCIYYHYTHSSLKLTISPILLQLPT